RGRRRGSGKRETGNWKLGTGHGQLAVGSWQRNQERSAALNPQSTRRSSRESAIRAGQRGAIRNQIRNTSAPAPDPQESAIAAYAPQSATSPQSAIRNPQSDTFPV